MLTNTRSCGIIFLSQKCDKNRRLVSMSSTMVNVKKLKGKIAENDVSLNDLASALNMSYDTLNRRMKNGDKFTIKEANCIVNYLRLSAEDAISIFFAGFVA